MKTFEVHLSGVQEIALTKALIELWGFVKTGRVPDAMANEPYLPLDEKSISAWESLQQQTAALDSKLATATTLVDDLKERRKVLKSFCDFFDG